MRPFKHKIRILHEHTGWKLTNKNPDWDKACTEWRGEIGLFLDTYMLKHVSRDAVGTRRADWVRWVPIRCNSTGCEFEALVRVDWIEGLVSKAIREELS